MAKNIRQNPIKTLLIAIGVLASVSLTQADKVDSVDKPNVILIYADDLGIGMLGCYGQKLVKTPHIDRLADEGIKFNNYYGGVFCAPARWTLLTGMHDGRFGGWKQSGAGLPIKRDAGEITEDEFQKKMVEVKANAHPIAKEEIFLGQIAQNAGYATAQLGKLDRGFLTWSERVQRFGWDFHEGYYDHQRAHGFYPPYLWRNGERFELSGNTDPKCGKMSEKGDEPVGAGGETYSQNVFIKGILKYIQDHQDKPFFIYHSTQLPHGPVAIPELHPDFADLPNLSLAEKKYASMVKILDDHVGLIMKQLKTLGLDKNTIVAFTSDNGHELYYGPKPAFHKQQTPSGEKTNLTDRKWRTSDCGDIFDGAAGRAGLKRSGYQGGIQCPMIVRWPGKISAGVETNHLSAHYDFMATLADIVGSKSPAGKDSLSYLPTLLGESQEETHDFIIVNNAFKKMGSSTIISKDGWKLVEIDWAKDHFQLYDLSTDNEEHYDLAAKFPDRVKQLKATLLSEINSPRPDLN